MTVLEQEGDEVRGEKLIVVFRKISGQYLVHRSME